MTHTSDDFLTAARVRDVYARCFRPAGSPRPSRVYVEAWMLGHTFSTAELAKSREEIVRMLLSLPEGFRGDASGGGSVAHATLRGDSVMWTGDMSDVEKLVALGMAVSLVSFCAPRDKWHRLPQGLPYVRVDITRFGVSVN